MLGRSSTKGSSSRSFQMPPPPPPPVHGAGGGRTTGAYTLWSTGGHSSGSPSTNTVSLKRDHKRKFNRSLCGVLLGISIVLVILGILGIIGIAVYLGGKLLYKCFPDRKEIKNNRYNHNYGNENIIIRIILVLSLKYYILVFVQ